MKCILFCRVSSKEQEETGYSLPAQEKFLREFAEKQGLTVDKVFAVSESASGRVQRKTFNELIVYVKKHNISVIIVETTDRLTRNFKDVPTIDKWVLEDDKNEIHLAKEGCVLNKNSKSHEWFMWRVKVATAEYYVRLLSENVKKGQKEKLAQGWLPTKPPLGYKTVGETGHKTHVIDETKSPLVKKMFELYASNNYSLLKLTQVMNKAGLRNDNGNKIVKSRIHQYLTDPFYIGKNQWNGQLTDGKQETFISKELFNKVQSILKGRNTPKYRKHNHLLKSLLHCFECNGTITWEIHKGIVYGHCNHYKECKQKSWVTEPQIEEQLVKAFENLQIKSPRLVEWIKKAIKEAHKDTITYYTASLDELNARQKLIEQRFERIYDDKIDGKITEEFYKNKFKQYSEEKDDVVEAIQKHSNATTNYFELAMNIYDLSQRAKEIYMKAKNIDYKRQLLRLVFKELKIDEGKLYYTYSNAFKILSEAVVATNTSSKVDKVIEMKKIIFEPSKKPNVMPQYDGFFLLRPVLLPGQDSNLEPFR